MNERTQRSLVKVVLDVLWILSCVAFVFYWVLGISVIGGPKAVSFFVVAWTVLTLPLLVLTLLYHRRVGIAVTRWCLTAALVSWLILVSLAIYFFAALDVNNPTSQPRLLEMMLVHALAALVFVISLTVYMVRALKLPSAMH